MDSSARQPSLVVLIGPPAVGKMTVGQELERLTGFRLFHTHQVIDLLTGYFTFGAAPFNRLLQSYNRQFFEEAADSGLQLITTFGLQFDLHAELAVVQSYVKPFLACQGRVYVVELLAMLATRLSRNSTGNRRKHKNVDWATDERLQRLDDEHLWDSAGTPPLDLPFLRLETDDLTAAQTARRIAAFFALPRLR